MFDITEKDLLAVYEQLKDQYDLVLTTSFALDEGFTVDCPVLVGKAHGQIMELYNDGCFFVLDIMDEAQTKGTHLHPNDVKAAAAYIEEFMNGNLDYELHPFKQIQRYKFLTEFAICADARDIPLRGAICADARERKEGRTKICALPDCRK